MKGKSIGRKRGTQKKTA